MAAAKPIEAVGTSTPAFVGLAPGGPVRRVQSLAEYERGSAGASALDDAVRLFFAGGATEVWVAPDVAALDGVPDLALLALPGGSDADVLREALSYADARRAFLIVDPPGDDPDGAVALVDALRSTGSANAAVYFPLLVIDGKGRTCAPSGGVAALYARSDPVRGVWSAPAGIDAVLPGAVDLAVSLDQAKASKLNEAHVNTIRAFPGRGIRLWGSRTIADSSSEWKYVPVRRLGLHLERSLDHGLEWATLEPNDELLWARVRAQVDGFLHDLFRAGAFQGRTPRDAYFVKCGEDTMTSQAIADGYLSVMIGIAPVRPAEFVVLRIEKQLAGEPAQQAS